MNLAENLAGNPQGEVSLRPINLGQGVVFGPKNPYNLPTMTDVSPESLQPQITLETAAKDMAQNLPSLVDGAVEILNQRVQELRSKFSPKNAKTLLSEILIVSMLASGCGFSNSTPESTPVPAPPTSEPAPSPTTLLPPSPVVMPTNTLISSTPTKESAPPTPTIVANTDIVKGPGVGGLTPEQMQTYNQLELDIKAWGAVNKVGGELFTTFDQTGFNITMKISDGKWGAWDQNKKDFVLLNPAQGNTLEWQGLAGMFEKDAKGNIISRYVFNQAKGAWELIVTPTPVPSPTVEKPTPTVPTGPDIKLYPAPTPTKVTVNTYIYDMDGQGNLTIRSKDGVQAYFPPGRDLQLLGEYTDIKGNVYQKFHFLNPLVPDGWILVKSVQEPTPIAPVSNIDYSRHFASQAVLSGELGRTAITAARVDPSGFEFTFDGSGTLFHVGGTIDKIIDAEHGVVLINNPVLGKFRYQFPKPGNDNVLNKSLIRVKRIMPDGSFSTTIIYLDNISFGPEKDVRSGEGDWIAFFPNFNNFAALNKTDQDPQRIALMQAAIKQFDASEVGKGAVPGFITLISR